MAGGKVYGGSDMTILIQDESRPCGSDVFESLWIPSSSPTFHGNLLASSHICLFVSCCWVYEILYFVLWCLFISFSEPFLCRVILESFNITGVYVLVDFCYIKLLFDLLTSMHSNLIIFVYFGLV